MGKYDSPVYDDPRAWIQKRREKHDSWDDLRLGCKGSVEKLIAFLHYRVEEDGWPIFTVEDWIALVNEIEEYEGKQKDLIFRGNDGALFDVKQDNGLSIPKGERSSWQLYKNSLGWKNVGDLEDATIGILRRLSNDTRTTGPIKGLVVGHVQSGKTANMEALMAMAADHGWNMFIVLSGSIENLRLQTLKRMQKDLNQEGNLIWRGVEHPSKRSQYGERAQDLHFEPGAQSRYFTVCLKHTSRLKKLIDWIHADKASHDLMRILVIDDEADQASISNTAVEYKKAEKERKGINRLIVNLVQDKHYKEVQTCGHALAMNYVMYTATPYANFLNESTPESLYPANFIWTLKTSNEYIGPNQIFGFNDPEKSDGLDIKRIVLDEDLDRIADIYEGISEELPERMKDAICWFICAVSVMRLWNYKKPISMLVHTSQKQICHEAVSQAINHWINSGKSTDAMVERCRRVYEYETNRITKQEWFSQFPDYGIPPEEVRDYPAFNSILPGIREILGEKMQHIKMTDEGDFQYHKGLHLVVDNCSKNGLSGEDDYVRLAYPDPDAMPSPAPAFIIVGGSTLSRGLTIEGLVSTFFLRASCQADTLMQMGRWFGYRRNYELLPRIWMTSDTIDKFRFLSELEVELRADLKKYMISEVRPIDYGPRILCSPKVSWLKLTSKKHMTNARPAEMDFSGAKPQTVIFDNSEDVQRHNIEVTEEFIKGLGAFSQMSHDKTALCWKGVSLETIMSKLLINKFSFSNRSRVFNEIGTFCEWIKQIPADDVLKNWSVIVAGNGTISPAGECDQKHWNLAGVRLGKVNRSRRIPREEGDTAIDIGALRALKDLVADAPADLVNSFGPITKQEHVDEIRKKAGIEKIPMLIIYRIDGKSTKRENSEDRIDMDMPCDIIGLQICVPGDQINKNFCKKMTITLPDKDKEEEVEEAI